MICSTAARESALCEDVCEQTFKAYTGNITGMRKLLLADPSDLATAVELVVGHQGHNKPFLLVPSTVFLTGPWNVAKPRKRLKFAIRKGDNTDRMVNTIRYLLDNGYPTFDYQLETPLLIDPEKGLEVAKMGRKYLFRTLYGNMMHTDPEPMEDPHMDPWIHSMDPKGPVVSLGPTALHHFKALQWLRKTQNACRSYDPTGLVQ